MYLVKKLPDSWQLLHGWQCLTLFSRLLLSRSCLFFTIRVFGRLCSHRVESTESHDPHTKAKTDLNLTALHLQLLTVKSCKHDKDSENSAVLHHKDRGEDSATRPLPCKSSTDYNVCHSSLTDTLHTERGCKGEVWYVVQNEISWGTKCGNNYYHKL